MRDSLFGENGRCECCDCLVDGKCTWEADPIKWRESWKKDFDGCLHIIEVKRTVKTLEGILSGDLSRFSKGLLLEYLDAAVDECDNAPTVSKLARRIRNALS